MPRTICTLIVAFLAATVALSGADPSLGTWKLNIAKSKFSPGPGPKSRTSVYSQDGEWIVSKIDAVNADGKATSMTNRYKRDGKEYPYQRAGGSGTISVKKIDDHHYETTTKAPNTFNILTVISKDGKTRTQTSTGVNAEGQKANSVSVYERQ